jgi:hypothetical protein
MNHEIQKVSSDFAQALSAQETRLFFLPILGYHTRMMDTAEIDKSPASVLCKSCNLCCTGHLFIWVKLKSSELDPMEAQGVPVFRSDPTQRGFGLPCPLWKGQCTIHASPHYPRTCRAYQCKLLKEVLAEQTPMPRALEVVDQAKAMIGELEAALPPSPLPSFRERLVAQIEHPTETAWAAGAYPPFRRKADALVAYYQAYFGVTDLIEAP